MFGLFKKKQKEQEVELVTGKFFVVKEDLSWGLYHIRTEGLEGYNRDIFSCNTPDPANKLARIYNDRALAFL